MLISFGDIGPAALHFFRSSFSYTSFVFLDFVLVDDAPLRHPVSMDSRQWFVEIDEHRQNTAKRLSQHRKEREGAKQPRRRWRGDKYHKTNKTVRRLNKIVLSGVGCTPENHARVILFAPQHPDVKRCQASFLANSSINCYWCNLTVVQINDNGTSSIPFNVISSYYGSSVTYTDYRIMNYDELIEVHVNDASFSVYTNWLFYRWI